MDWIGQTLGGRYRIEALLGQGGMSSVYRGSDPNLRRAVAIKLIHPHLSSDPEFVGRFEVEATAVARLRHPNIVQVYDFDHENDLYYIVLEYVPGETLETRLKRLNGSGRRLPLADVVKIALDVCDAVEYAHRRGMVHRDIKPANVMLNVQGQAILMDFGVARMLGGKQHTATGVVIGTALYMSPEQIRGERPDHRADIYSLGGMLFEMVTGRPPFEAGSVMNLMLMHLNDPVPDIGQLNRETPPELETAVKKALAKSAADRFQTAAEMAVALRRIRFAPQGRVSAGVTAIERPGLPVVATLRSAPEAERKGSVVQPSPPAANLQLPQHFAERTIVERARPVAPARIERVRKRRRAPFLLGAAVLAVVIVAGILAVLLLPGILSGSPGQLPSAQAMAKVDAGTYLIGRYGAGDANYVPARPIELPAFWIDRYETTNTEYAAFVIQTGRNAPLGWLDGQFPPGEDHHPVRGVSFADAGAHCDSLGKQLPTEAEWEAAARGPDARPFPWGEDPQTVRFDPLNTYPVGSLSANQSFFGIYDMAGNVWEWVREPYQAVEAGNQVLRGGSYNYLQDMAYRLEVDPDVPTAIADAGFRCAAAEVQGES